MNVGEGLSPSYDFVGAAGVTAPCLLDDGALYDSYPREIEYAPFPMQVLIDADGAITYIGETYDVDRLRAAIEAVLGG